MKRKRIYRKKTKKADCRKSYTVRFNVGELYLKPPSNVWHWTMSVDERGGYWTRIIKENSRAEAVYWTLRWFANLMYRIKKRPSSVFHQLPIKFADACIEVSDDSNEVVFTPTMQPTKPLNRLLPPDKLNDIIQLSKGTFEKTTDFSKRGCFTQTKEYKNKKHRERLVKVPHAPYVYENSNTGRYHARIRVQSKITEGGGATFLGCERGENGHYSRVFWKHKRGKIAQQPKNKTFLLKNTSLPEAVAEAIKIRKQFERGKTGFKSLKS